MSSPFVVVCGQTGSGKTTWVKQRIEKAPRLVVIDPLAEYGHVGGVARGQDECLSRLLALSAANVPRFRLAMQLPSSQVDEVLRALWSFQDDFENPDQAKMIQLVVDEADRVSEPGDRDTGMDILLQYGRRVVSVCYLVTRRLARISRDATSNAGSLVMFACQEPLDLRDLAHRRGKPAVEAVQQLGQFKWIQF